MVEQSSQLTSKHPVCDGKTLIRLAEAGRDWLDHHHDVVNQLNVFPVPDGDTGTNMLLTMRNAVKEVTQNPSDSVSDVAARIARGAMMGSRGNSGTILSQLWQGFALAVKDQPVITTELMVKGLRGAADTAYRGVIKPVEGTILTVAREAAEEAEVAFAETHDMIFILERVVQRAKLALAHTPELLPILKKAGVVDSGGSGLVYILEGMLRLVRGETVIGEERRAEAVEDLATALAPEDELGYGYDVQFILQGESLSVEVVRAAIDAMGWSTLVVGDETAIKVHVHVHDPGIPLSYGANLGHLSDIVVENMQAQFQDYVRERAAHEDNDHVADDISAPELGPDDVGVVAVASGEGLARVFRQLGAAELVMGGQTNNPSTQEILEAVLRVNTQQVILLPNNKNIILAAEQAARLAEEQGISVHVIPTRSMPQGISAMLPYDPHGDLEQVASAMHDAKDDVATGEITVATRTVEINGVQVEEGQTIGLVNGNLAVSGDDMTAVVIETLEKMCSADCELVTLYYGNDVQPAEAQEVIEILRNDFEDREFELVYGGQPHYAYILSAE